MVRIDELRVNLKVEEHMSKEYCRFILVNGNLQHETFVILKVKKCGYQCYSFMLEITYLKTERLKDIVTRIGLIIFGVKRILTLSFYPLFN